MTTEHPRTFADYRRGITWVGRNAVSQEGVETNDFQAASQIISQLADRISADDPLGLARFRAGVLAAMVLGLGDAANAGAFGDRNSKTAVTLCCSVEAVTEVRKLPAAMALMEGFDASAKKHEDDPEVAIVDLSMRSRWENRSVVARYREGQGRGGSTIVDES